MFESLNEWRGELPGPTGEILLLNASFYMWVRHEVVVWAAAKANLKNLKVQCEDLAICWIHTQNSQGTAYDQSNC